jgi:hypothetical protein
MWARSGSGLWTNQGGWQEDGWGRAVAAVGGEAAVLVDVAGNSNLDQSAGGTTSMFLAAGVLPTVGSGPNGTSNMCLIVSVLFGNANGGTTTGVAATWDSTGSSQAMTQVPGGFVQNGASGGDVYMFYRMNPVLGSKGLTITWTGANGAFAGIASFVNVDQTGGTTTFPSVVTSTSGASISPGPASPTTRKMIAAFSGVNNYTAATDLDVGHNNTGNLFAQAIEYANGSNASLSYGGGAATGASIAAIIKGH